MNDQEKRDATYKRIWWIASYPKSGSTWVRMFVNAYVTGWPIDINSAFQYVTGDLQPQTYQLTSAKPITDLTDLDTVYYRQAVLLNYLYTSPSQHFALKTHNAKLLIDGIPLIPPRLSVGALYVIRDPRDVVISFADHLGVDIDKAIEIMGSNQGTLQKNPYKLFHYLASWSTHVDSWTVQNKDVRTEVVRYEDMLASPKTTFPLVLKAMGIEPTNQERLDFALEQTRFARLKQIEQDKGFREKGNGEAFFRTGKSGSWMDKLTPRQIKTIEKNHRHAMARWKYVATTTEQPMNTMARVQSVAAGIVT